MKRQVDFIGIGAMKSGSTWLAQCLGEHPQVCCRYKKGEKELRFFNSPDWGDSLVGMDSNYDKGIDWYMSKIKPTASELICGEVSVGYLHDPISATRINKYFPKVKIIVVLREPVNMLYSLYNFLSSGVVIRLPDSFEKFMRVEKYRNIAMYHKHLTPYFKLFPKGNILVLLQDDILKEPSKFLRELYTFLEVDSSFSSSVLKTRVNPAFGIRFMWLKRLAQEVLVLLNRIGLGRLRKIVMRNKPIFRIYSFVNKEKSTTAPLSALEKKKHRKYFSEEITKLEKLIEKDLSDWR